MTNNKCQIRDGKWSGHRSLLLTAALVGLISWHSGTSTSNRPGVSTLGQGSPVHVITPNGGERILAGSTYTITWSIDAGTDVVFQNVSLSTDGGDSFEQLNASNLSGAARSYQWRVSSFLETEEARIMVFAANPNAFLLDISDENFTVFQPNIPPAQENVTLAGGGSQNQLNIRTASASVTSPVTGFVDLTFSPAEDPNKRAVQLTALSLAGGSVMLENKPTGQLLFSKEHTTVAGGSYDTATGEFSVPVSVALIYDALLLDGQGWLTEDPDARNSPRPVTFSGLLTGKRNKLGTATGTLEGVIQSNAPLLTGATVTINWSGRLTGGGGRMPTVFCPTFCLDVKVIADDASGNGAVATPAMIESALAAANTIWGQCAIAFTLRDADPQAPGLQPTYIADGNFRAITDQGAGLTDEEVALTSLSRDGRCIDVYIVEQFVYPDGRASPERGLTLNSGMSSAGMILRKSGLTDAEFGMALAHLLGHALGLPHDAVPNSNLMSGEMAGGMALNASQGVTASIVNPLAERQSCRGRTFRPMGPDVVITGLGGPDTVARGGTVTTTIVGRGLANAQAVEFPPNSGVTAEVLESADTFARARVSAAGDAPSGPVRFSVKTPNGSAGSGLIVLNIR